MAEEVGIDQETFDREIAAGKPERVARAMAKSAWVRKNRGPAGPGVKKEEAAAAPAEAAPAAAAAPGAPAATVTVAAPAATMTERLTPEQRAARVAAATGRAPGGNG